MPLRDLFYISGEYQKLVNWKYLYTSTRMRISAPNFIVFYNGKEEVSGGYPFIATTTKTIHKLIPDRQRPIKVRLTRKYPVNPMAYGLNNALKNLRIERSDFYDFRKTEAFRIGRIENDFLQEIE